MTDNERIEGLNRERIELLRWALSQIVDNIPEGIDTPKGSLAGLTLSQMTFLLCVSRKLAKSTLEAIGDETGGVS
jgi:hypothetical protein